MPSAYDVVFNGHEGDEWTAEEWLASGRTRTAIDTAWDYPGEWQGEEDGEDVMGPSIDPDGFDTTNDIRVIDWRSRISDESDPTNPDNIGTRWKAALAVGAVVVLLIALRPYASIGAGVLGE